MSEPRMLAITAAPQRWVHDPVTGQHWACQVAARRPAFEEHQGEGWIERVSCRHEGMEVELDLPLGELGLLADDDLLERIVERIAS